MVIKNKKKSKRKQKGGDGGMCSPDNNDYNYSCFTLQDLKNMAKQVNKRFKSNIKINSYKAKDKARLVRDIHHALNCGNLS